MYIVVSKNSLYNLCVCLLALNNPNVHFGAAVTDCNKYESPSNGTTQPECSTLSAPKKRQLTKPHAQGRPDTETGIRSQDLPNGSCASTSDYLKPVSNSVDPTEKKAMPKQKRKTTLKSNCTIRKTGKRGDQINRVNKTRKPRNKVKKSVAGSDCQLTQSTTTGTDWTSQPTQGVVTHATLQTTTQESQQSTPNPNWPAGQFMDQPLYDEDAFISKVERDPEQNENSPWLNLAPPRTTIRTFRGLKGVLTGEDELQWLYSEISRNLTNGTVVPDQYPVKKIKPRRRKVTTSRKKKGTTKKRVSKKRTPKSKTTEVSDVGMNATGDLDDLEYLEMKAKENSVDEDLEEPTPEELDEIEAEEAEESKSGKVEHGDGPDRLSPAPKLIINITRSHLVQQHQSKIKELKALKRIHSNQTMIYRRNIKLHDVQLLTHRQYIDLNKAIVELNKKMIAVYENKTFIFQKVAEERAQLMRDNVATSLQEENNATVVDELLKCCEAVLDTLTNERAYHCREIEVLVGDIYLSENQSQIHEEQLALCQDKLMHHQSEITFLDEVIEFYEEEVVRLCKAATYHGPQTKLYTMQVAIQKHQHNANLTQFKQLHDQIELYSSWRAYHQRNRELYDQYTPNIKAKTRELLAYTKDPKLAQCAKMDNRLKFKRSRLHSYQVEIERLHTNVTGTIQRLEDHHNDLHDNQKQLFVNDLYISGNHTLIMRQRSRINIDKELARAEARSKAVTYKSRGRWRYSYPITTTPRARPHPNISDAANANWLAEQLEEDWIEDKIGEDDDDDEDEYEDEDEESDEDE